MSKFLKINLLIKYLLILIILISVSSCDQSEKAEKKFGSGKVIVKVFSSLTCPHCANFHLQVIVELKKKYNDSSQVEFKHVSFPLDLAALNAEKIMYCFNNNEKRFDFLTEIYKNQKSWAVGSDIILINDSIKKIGKKLGLESTKMNKCLEDDKIQEKILNERISAQKKYKISSTPTIYINKKKYTGKHEFNAFEKEMVKEF